MAKKIVTCTPKIMTDQEYVNADGMCCPLCKSRSIESGDIQADGQLAWAKCVCNLCCSEWTEHYKLVGFCDLHGYLGMEVSSSNK